MEGRPGGQLSGKKTKKKKIPQDHKRWCPFNQIFRCKGNVNESTNCYQAKKLVEKNKRDRKGNCVDAANSHLPSASKGLLVTYAQQEAKPAGLTSGIL